MNRFRCKDTIELEHCWRKYFTRKFLRIFFRLFALQCLNPKLHVYNFTIFFLNVKWYRWKFNWKWNCFASIISIFLLCCVFESHLKWSRFLISWARKYFVRFAKWKWINTSYSSVFMFSVAVPCCMRALLDFFSFVLSLHRYWFSLS